MKMKLKVDGKEILLNDFVEKMLGGMVKGGVEALKGIDSKWETIVIEIEK
jgi:hypothetical protein